MNRLVLFLLLCPLLLRAQTLYITSGNGAASTLYTVNPATAQGTSVGSVVADISGVSTGLVITGMAFHPTSGVLYGVTGNNGSVSGALRKLVTINPQSGQATIIGGLGGIGVSDISFSAAGVLYGWSTGGQLVTLNLTTGQYTGIGSANINMPSGGLSFSPGGTLYVANNSNTVSAGLWTANTSSGALSLVSVFSAFPANFGKINSSASDSAGLLYATGNSTGHQLITINSSNATVASMGVLSFGEADALAFQTAVVPEPGAAALLLALGGAGGYLLHRRRHFRRGRH